MSPAQEKAWRKGASAPGMGSGAGFGGFTSSIRASSLSYVAELPDLSSISDATVVVSFKSLLKKDSTTKARGLEDLVSYVQAHPYEKNGGPEKAILEAWVGLYPRISIDNARRVRELSNTLQVEFMKSARKRMEKYIPEIVGPWLASLHDRDRAISRSANDNLLSLLGTPEKVTQFWRKCQPHILEYASQALQETEDTLSDQRSTVPEDSEAKYIRVVNGCLCLILSLLQKLEKADIDQFEENYNRIFAEEKVWKSVSLNDTAVRRTTCQLLYLVLELRPDSIAQRLPKLKRIFIVDGFKSNQIGSAADFVRALTKLTQTYPDIWSASGKDKSPVSRLPKLLEKGSQSSQVVFWEHLAQLLVLIPCNEFSVESATQVMKALRAGISRRDELRLNAHAAWACYIHVASHLLSNPSMVDLRPKFAKENLLPLLVQYMHPIADDSAWTIAGPKSLNVVARSFHVVNQSLTGVDRQLLHDQLSGLTGAFCGRISNSLPQVSQDHQKSQEEIAAEGNRWFTFVNQVISHSTAEDISDLLASLSTDIVKACIELLKTRNYKPFGAASVLKYATSAAPTILAKSRLLLDNGGSPGTFSLFLVESARDFAEFCLMTRSAPELVSCIENLSSKDMLATYYQDVWKAWIEGTLKYPTTDYAEHALTSLISQKAAAKLASEDTKLQEYLASKCLEATSGSGDTWKLFEATFASDILSDTYSLKVLKGITEDLENAYQANTSDALRSLEIIAHCKPELLSRDEVIHMSLVTRLLALTEVSDSNIASRAALSRVLLENKLDGKPSSVRIIQENLDNAGPQSLEIDTLIAQALQLIKSGEVPLEELFPSSNIWMEQIGLLSHKSINPSLSITNALGSALDLAVSPENAPRHRSKRDRSGQSIPARMATYTTKLLSSGVLVSSLPTKFQVEIVFLLYLVVQMTTDEISMMSSWSDLWGNFRLESTVSNAAEFVTLARKNMNSIINEATAWQDGDVNGSTSLVDELLGIMVQQSSELTPLGFYSARALAEVIQGLIEAHGIPLGDDEKLRQIVDLKATASTFFPSVALLIGCGDILETSKMVGNLCNRLVSDVAGMKSNGQKALMSLLLLDACMQVYEIGDLPVANNRIVFAVKQLTSWMDDPSELSDSLCTAVCRCLRYLLPCIKSVYGEHWEKTISFCMNLWNRAPEGLVDAAIPYLHASLKLIASLEALPDRNDDLEDALSENSEMQSRLLIQLLGLPREEHTRPHQAFDELLCRHVQKIPLRHLNDPSSMYTLLASDSRDIQTAAFSLLHKVLPASQEQISIDVLLDKRDARLPDELLSLLLDAPTLEKYSDDELNKFPVQVRSYLLAWDLIFDAYSTASAKVRTDYTEGLKAEDLVSPLMNFTFDILGHSVAHPINLDKSNFTAESIIAYDIHLADAESDERSMQWLLIHLYYRSLKYLPNLFKSWYIDCKSKQTKIAVDSWTTKYFSPLIISEMLDEVAAWAAAQDAPAEDESELVVKVRKAAREITAGYEVDESEVSIAIQIPQSFPIDSVSVVGTNRMVVNEKKWQSWVMTVQGVIIFSNGSIIDGLVAFRRNIVGALKGQSECAICYSIISTDKRMPDKRCHTCRNQFHRVCLYKWFQTSNQNTCPLCRNPIDYIGTDSKSRRVG
jgi:E3 ubiquitin-protein ligase listerin